jgi:hypothetical protein
MIRCEARKDLPLAPSLLCCDRRFFSSKKTMQKIRLRYSHGKLQTKAISAPSAQSYFVACFWRLGDIEIKMKNMLTAFFHFYFNVGYA